MMTHPVILYGRDCRRQNRHEFGREFGRVIQIHVQKDDLSLFMTKFTSKFTT